MSMSGVSLTNLRFLRFHTRATRRTEQHRREGKEGTCQQQTHSPLKLTDLSGWGSCGRKAAEKLVTEFYDVQSKEGSL